MNASRLAAVVLIALGALSLAYGGFTYTKDRQEMHLGSMSVTMSDNRTVAIPVWAGVAAIVLGTGLLMVPSKGS